MDECWTRPKGPSNRGQGLLEAKRLLEMVGRMVGGMAGGTVGGIVSLSTRQTPQIDDNTPARGGIAMYNGGLVGG